MMQTKSILRPIFCFLIVCVLLCMGMSPLAAQAEIPTELIPGGSAFGVKYYAKGAIVIGVCDVETASGLASPARQAGLAAGDIITSVDGKEVQGTEQLLEQIKACDGKTLEIAYTRGEQSEQTQITPALDKTLKEYRMGIWVRDSTAGIGTITFVDAQSKRFGGLGHGINDSATGVLLPLGKGSVVDVTITGVVKGRKSVPGELKGEFRETDVGCLRANTEVGVFGFLKTLPESLSKPLPVASASEVHTGKACIRCEADGSVREYAIEIEEVYADSGNTKNFLIHVTDPALLSLTGGIVQGMSGSPILQDGKLIGAVTHVLVNDPTRGFGIHIENMLAELEKIA